MAPFAYIQPPRSRPNCQAALQNYFPCAAGYYHNLYCDCIPCPQDLLDQCKPALSADTPAAITANCAKFSSLDYCGLAASTTTTTTATTLSSTVTTVVTSPKFVHDFGAQSVYTTASNNNSSASSHAAVNSASTTVVAGSAAAAVVLFLLLTAVLLLCRRRQRLRRRKLPPDERNNNHSGIIGGSWCRFIFSCLPCPRPRSHSRSRGNRHEMREIMSEREECAATAVEEPALPAYADVDATTDYYEGGPWPPPPSSAPDIPDLPEADRDNDDGAQPLGSMQISVPLEQYSSGTGAAVI